MAVWSTTAPALALGDTFTLSSASLGGANLTQAVCVDDNTGNPANLTIFNHSAVVLTIKVADTNTATTDFLTLSGPDTIAATSALSFSTTAPFVAVLPASDPGATLITIRR